MRGSNSSGSSDVEGNSASGWDTTYDDDARAKIDDNAAYKYGRRSAQEGTDLAVDLTKDMAFNQQMLVAHAPEGSQRLIDVSQHMTDSCGREWRSTVNTFVNGTEQQHDDISQDVYALTFYDAFDGAELKHKKWDINREGPAAVNPEVKSVSAALDNSGRLHVKVKVAADLRTTLAGAPRISHVDRKVDYWMVETSEGWKIDGFKGFFKVGEMRPEKATR